MKKVWKPCKLIVLERKTTEEAVLQSCKFAAAGPASNNNACLRVDCGPACDALGPS